MMKPERLTEDESEWGLSRLTYAFRAKLAARNAARQRRASYLQQIRIRPRGEDGRFLAAAPAFDGEVFTTSSGIKAVRVKRPRLTNSVVDVGWGHELISLPYVAFQHGRGE